MEAPLSPTSPTKQQIVFAKRMVRRVMETALHRSSGCHKLPILATPPSSAALAESVLPLDVLRELFRRLDPDTLLACSLLCRMCFMVIERDAMLWKQHIAALIKLFDEDPQSLLLIGPSDSFTRSSYLALARDYEFYIASAAVCKRLEQDLHKPPGLRRSATEILMDKQTLENLFDSKLCLSPWKSMGSTRLLADFKALKHPAFYISNYSTEADGSIVFKCQLLLTSGFYAQDFPKVDFQVTVTTSYPYDPPTVKCLTKDVYHPYVDENGLLTLPAALDCFRGPRLSIKDNYLQLLLDAIYRLFTEPKYLTEICNV